MVLEASSHQESAKSREQIRAEILKRGKCRILSLDGGGIRGALTTAVLIKLEAMLRAKYECHDLRLCDYFQYVGGTSTGSLIAAGIAKGMTATDLHNIYSQQGSSIFIRTRPWLRPYGLGWLGGWSDRLFTKYKADGLERLLQEKLGQTTFSDKKDLQCGLLVVAECITADCLTDPSQSAVMFTSISAGTSTSGVYSQDVKLWEACRASSAAPTYFPPFTMKWSDRGMVPFIGIGRGPEADDPPRHEALLPTQGDFIDGAISGYNNPGNAILKFITQPRYGNGPYPTEEALLMQEPVFQRGPDRVLLVSIGTGKVAESTPQGKAESFWAHNWGLFLVKRLMNGSEAQETLAAAMECHNVLDLDMTTFERPLFSTLPRDVREEYIRQQQRATRLRYNVRLDKEALEHLDPMFSTLTPEAIKALQEMDVVDETNVTNLTKIGEKLAEKYLNEDHYEDFW